MWRCPSCRETHVDQFDACWQCGFEREVAEEIVDSPELPGNDHPTIPSDSRHGSRRPTVLWGLLAAMVVLATAAYSLMAVGWEGATVSELSLLVAVACIGLYFLARYARRRRFRYGLRALLVGVLSASVGLSWLLVKVQDARRQSESVDAITKAGGRVMYDYQLLGRQHPSWRQELSKSDLFATIFQLHIKSDRMLERVDALSQIQQIYLSSTQVTNASMEHLKESNHLEHLEIKNTRVTDAGLTGVKRLPRLRRLMLFNNALTDVGLEHLGELVQLRWLYLHGTQITDAGLAHLEGLTRLEALCVSSDRISDVGLLHLKGLTRLNNLSLEGTQVTDAGLEYLEGLGRLQNLGLRGTRVTDDGVEKLQRILPNCTIRR